MFQQEKSGKVGLTENPERWVGFCEVDLEQVVPGRGNSTRGNGRAESEYF